MSNMPHCLTFVQYMVVRPEVNPDLAESPFQAMLPRASETWDKTDDVVSFFACKVPVTDLKSHE